MVQYKSSNSKYTECIDVNEYVMLTTLDDKKDHCTACFKFWPQFLFTQKRETFCLRALCESWYTDVEIKGKCGDNDKAVNDNHGGFTIHTNDKTSHLDTWGHNQRQLFVLGVHYLCFCNRCPFVVKNVLVLKGKKNRINGGPSLSQYSHCVFVKSATKMYSVTQLEREYI